MNFLVEIYRVMRSNSCELRISNLTEREAFQIKGLIEWYYDSDIETDKGDELARVSPQRP